MFAQKGSCMKKIIPLITLITSLNTHALVDYTDSSDYSAPAVKTRAKSVKRVSKRAAPRKRQSSGARFLELKTTYMSQNFDVVNTEGQNIEEKVSTIQLDGRIDTAYDVYLEFSLPMHSGRIETNQQETSFQKGNPKVLLGLNWLQFGAAQTALGLDIYGGAVFSSDSEFASKRTDKIVGLNTSKRFFDFGFGLNYELALTGSSDDSLEQDIGTIQQLKAQLGWMVSSDIRFVVTANTVKIAKSNDEGRVNKLEKDIKYAYIKPEVILALSPNIDFHMMATFQSRRAKNELISTSAKLWNLEGFYGNSLAAALNLSI
jgi:hypothetical protein